MLVHGAVWVTRHWAPLDLSHTNYSFIFTEMETSYYLWMTTWPSIFLEKAHKVWKQSGFQHRNLLISSVKEFLPWDDNVLRPVLPMKITKWYQCSSVQLLSHVQLFETPWIAARQASLSITNSQSSLRLTSIKSVMPSSHLILCHPLLLLPPIPPSIRVFSNESTLRMR